MAVGGTPVTIVPDSSGGPGYSSTNPFPMSQVGSTVVAESWINGVATQKDLGDGVDPDDNSTAVPVPATATSAQVFVRGSRCYYALTTGTITAARAKYADPGQIITFDSDLDDVQFLGDASTVLAINFNR